MFWIGIPAHVFEHILSVDQFGLWREHLAWSKSSGSELRSLVVQRFASNTVFLSLLTSSMIGVLFSPSKPMDAVRIQMKARDHNSLQFWAGICLCITVFSCISALYTNFTAWSIISSISDENSHVLLRSTIGLYAAQLPMRLVSLVIFFFILTMDLFLFILMPVPWALGICISTTLILLHLASTYSAFGRVIIETGAMSHDPIMTTEQAEELEPHDLHMELLSKRASAGKQVNVSVSHRYRVVKEMKMSMRDLETGINEVSPEEKETMIKES
jgi:hypothetical protein